MKITRRKKMGKTAIRNILIPLAVIAAGIAFASCSENDIAEMRYAKDQRTAMFQSEYARTVNQLEMGEGNFKSYRRVTFYNVRLGETVFTCEGYCHVQVDKDGDIEIVVKTSPDSYLRHYLGQKQDITYFSEQLKPAGNSEFYYRIAWNPKLWIPGVLTETVR